MQILPLCRRSLGRPCTAESSASGKEGSAVGAGGRPKPAPLASSGLAVVAWLDAAVVSGESGTALPPPPLAAAISPVSAALITLGACPAAIGGGGGDPAGVAGDAAFETGAAATTRRPIPPIACCACCIARCASRCASCTDAETRLCTNSDCAGGGGVANEPGGAARRTAEAAVGKPCWSTVCVAFATGVTGGAGRVAALAAAEARDASRRWLGEAEFVERCAHARAPPPPPNARSHAALAPTEICLTLALLPPPAQL